MGSCNFSPLFAPFFISVLSPYVSRIHREYTNPKTSSVHPETLIV